MLHIILQLFRLAREREVKKNGSQKMRARPHPCDRPSSELQVNSPGDVTHDHRTQREMKIGGGNSVEHTKQEEYFHNCNRAMQGSTPL